MRTPPRPHRRSSFHVQPSACEQQLFSPAQEEEEEEEDDVLDSLVKDGVTIRSLVRKLNLEAPYDLCMDENRRELYKRNMSQDGLGLAATYEESGTHKTNAKMLNEHVAHLTRSVDKKIREKEERIRAFLARENEELDALKRAKEVASGDLVGFRDIYNSFNNEN